MWDSWSFVFVFFHSYGDLTASGGPFQFEGHTFESKLAVQDTG